MKRMARLVLIMGLPLIVGVVATLAFVKFQPLSALSWLRVEPEALVDTAQPVNIAPPATVPPETALDMSFSTLTDTLRQEKGFALDHYSLSYLIIANQQMMGLLRTVETSEADPTIRSRAASLRTQMEKDTTGLLLMQKQLGHLHH